MTMLSPEIRLAAIGGLGDVFLTCALAGAVEHHYGVPSAVVLRERHLPILQMFQPAPMWEPANEELFSRAERDHVYQSTYSNTIESGWLWCSPRFRRTPVRLDHLTCLEHPSHLDMYRCLMGLDLRTLPTEAKPPQVAPLAKTVFLVTDARSWPNVPLGHWMQLARALSKAGWTVLINNPEEPLDVAFETAARAAWVIGPQCGFMSILCAAEFPCRKTFITAPLAGSDLPILGTFPYAYARKFMGRDYDIEELEWGPSTVQQVMAGKNAHELPFTTRPVPIYEVGVTAGDLLDRMSIAGVKDSKLTGEARALNQREYLRLLASSVPVFAQDPEGIGTVYNRLFWANAKAFEANEATVRDTFQGLNNQLALENHQKAIHANRHRIEAKEQINAITGSAWNEQKSYYDREPAKEG